mmetsp:Transcript_342/g.620  ORF Transcript_342/g.620 Transcript_342/m.620 type:complete len:174 (-) Transcript_342:126-647(-)
MGTKETLGRGSIQFMTAGTGVTHSEHNLDKRHPLRFIQIWITPLSQGLQPNYGSMKGSDVKELRKNKWGHLVSDVANIEVSTPVKINQDANIFVSELEPGTKTSFQIAKGRQAYLLCIEGSVEVEGTRGAEGLSAHDAAEVVGPAGLEFEAGEAGAHCLLIEMKGTGQSSRFR